MSDHVFETNPTQSPTTGTRICPISGESFIVTQSDIHFYTQISPTFAGQKFAIPVPTLSPTERQRRRLSFRNERHLYKRKCDASGKDIISIYSPDKPYKVYDQKIRRGDSRDPLSYGRDFDFTQTFTENFRGLMRDVPRYNLYNFDNENSEYVQYVPHSKNCYLVFGGWYNEDCLYSGTLMECKDCVDGLYLSQSTLCYECVDLEHCQACFFCFNCHDCADCRYLDNCSHCTHCIACINLVNKSYCIFNKQYTKEEFIQKKKEILSDPSLRFHRKSYFSPIIRRNLTIENSEHCYGDYIYNSKNIIDAFQSRDSEDISHSMRFANQKNSMDIYGSAKGSLLYNSLCCDYAYNVVCGFDSEHCSDCLYIDHCFHSDHCFGCVGLRNKSYYIFNKQYSKEEYEKQLAKIVSHMITTEEWGEFFHPSLSPFGYNETVAQEYFPIEAERGMLKVISPSACNVDLSVFGYTWSSYESPLPHVDKVIQGKDLPTSIDDVSDDILKTAIVCELTNKVFRIIPQELLFYRKYHLPLPRRHPDQRHLDRIIQRNPHSLRETLCAKCHMEINTSYPLDSKEVIYCDACYAQEVYG